VRASPSERSGYIAVFANKNVVILTTVDHNSHGRAITLKRNNSPYQGTNKDYRKGPSVKKCNW